MNTKMFMFAVFAVITLVKTVSATSNVPWYEDKSLYHTSLTERLLRSPNDVSVADMDDYARIVYDACEKDIFEFQNTDRKLLFELIKCQYFTQNAAVDRDQKATFALKYRCDNCYKQGRGDTPLIPQFVGKTHLNLKKCIHPKCGGLTYIPIQEILPVFDVSKNKSVDRPKLDIRGNFWELKDHHAARENEYLRFVKDLDFDGAQRRNYRHTYSLDNQIACLKIHKYETEAKLKRCKDLVKQYDDVLSHECFKGNPERAKRSGKEILEERRMPLFLKSKRLEDYIPKIDKSIKIVEALLKIENDVCIAEDTEQNED